MSERRGLNKHIDETQQQIEALQKKKFKAKLKEQGLTEKDLKYEFHNQNKIRLMNPIPLTCLSCGTYIPKYRKFNGYKREVNSAKEKAGEHLSKIKIFELKFKCFLCSTDIILRTDPFKAASIDAKDSLFADEAGASNNVKKEDGFVIVSGATKLQGDSDSENSSDQVNLLLDSINRERKLEEDQRLNELNKGGNIQTQLDDMQKQQRDDETLEQMQRREAQKNIAIQKMKHLVVAEAHAELSSAKEKVEFIKMVNKPKSKKKKKIIKL
ncbi:hypothetical protein QEN19_003046 [Hanseniaspora menglaensis]